MIRGKFDFVPNIFVRGILRGGELIFLIHSRKQQFMYKCMLRLNIFVSKIANGVNYFHLLQK